MFRGCPSDYTVPSLGLAILERVTEQMPGTTAAYKKAADIFRRKLEGILEGNVVLLCPPHPIVAPLHG